MDFHLQQMVFKIENLFPGNEELGNSRAFTLTGLEYILLFENNMKKLHDLMNLCYCQFWSSFSGEEVNKFLNNNWDILMIEFGPGIAEVISKIITDIFDNLAAAVPVKYVFLDDPVYKFKE